MQATVEREELLAAVAAAARAVPQRAEQPVLQGLLLEAQGGTLTATGRDGSFAVRRAATAQVVQPGAIVLPARPLLEIVRRFGPGPVRIQVDGGSATLRWQHTRMTLRGMDAQRYPAPSGDEEGETVTVGALDFEDLVRRTTFAVSRDEARPVLMGVELIYDGQVLRAIATDGFRVAWVEREGLAMAPAGQGVVLAGRDLAEAGRLVAASGADAVSVTFGTQGQTATIRAGRTCITVQVLDGPYPDVPKLLPAAYPHRLVVPRRELLAVIERAMLVAGHPEVVVFEPVGDRLVVRASDAQWGESRQEVPAQIAGTPPRIAFRARYLIEGLRLMGEDEVEIGLVQSHQAARLRGVGSMGFTYIVLPVQLRRDQAA